MEHVKDFGAGDSLTTEVLGSHARSIQELQRRAIRTVRPPLWFRDGTLGVETGQNAGAYFPVIVQWKSGAMGGTTTKCAALYKVTDIITGKVLGNSDPSSTPTAGTAIAPAKPRTKGLVVANAARGTGIYDGTAANCPAYGTGFYDPKATTPDHFVLWDAGEVESSGGCLS